MTLFLSSSLLSIETSYKTKLGSFEINVASVLFAEISLQCPKLEILDLFPIVNASRIDDTTPPPPALYLYQQIGTMQNLRILHANISVLECGALPFLGNLPQLDTLKIYEAPMPASSSPRLSLATIVLPCDSFPALRILSLPPLDESEIRSIWRIQPLAARPVTAQLMFRGLEGERNLEDLLSYICICSPQIVDLTLDYTMTFLYSGEPSSFSPLQRLSLNTLSITGLDLAPSGLACEVLSATFSSLRELWMPEFQVMGSELWHFVGFPQLEALSVGLDWESCAEFSLQHLKPVWVSQNLRQFDSGPNDSMPLESIEVINVTQCVVSYLSTCF